MWVSKYGDLKNIDLFTALKGYIEDTKIKSVDFVKSSPRNASVMWSCSMPTRRALGEAARYIGALVRELEVDSALPLLLAVYSTYVTD